MISFLSSLMGGGNGLTDEALKPRFKPKRRNSNAKSAHSCLTCDLYTPVDDSPCLWKLEAQIDAGLQHYITALKYIRQLTSVKQRKISHFTPTEAPV